MSKLSLNQRVPFAPHLQTQRSPWDGDHAVGFANLAEASLLLFLFLIAAALSMLPTTRALLAVWTSDPLRSFGSLLPHLGILLTVRAWRGIGWRFDPRPAGLALVVLAVFGSRASEGLLLTYRVGSLSLDPLQPALLLVLFFSGAILLLGGPLLWKRSIFPLCLLLCVNPVPHFFTTWVDFPLQRMSADVARSFAHLLGLYPTGQQLQLMFTPQFGMQIIPGCNGMRGAATMAYGTLILSYIRGYRPRRRALLTVIAAALGYLLNFLRLCLLVLYYAIGRNHPGLRGDGVLVDYIIGGCLFLTVSTLAGALWVRGGDAQPGAPEWPVDWPALIRRPVLLATACVLALSSLAELPGAYGLARWESTVVAPERAFHAMPAQAGSWARSDVYSTEVLDGVPHWVWAKYRTTDDRSVDFGIWLMPFQHFALQSRQVHGVEPDWTGTLHGHAASGVAVQMADFVARDDVGQDGSGTGYFAETTCLGSRCSSHVAGFEKQGWSAAMGPAAMRTTLRLPIQFRVRHTGQISLSQEERAADESLIRDLLSHVDTTALTQTLGFR